MHNIIGGKENKMSTKSEIINRLKSEKRLPVERLITSLLKHGIDYNEKESELLDNVVFKKGSMVFKCAYEMFFRYSGRCVYKDNNDEMKFMTDDMFYDWIKMFILFKLGVEKA